MLDFSKQLQCAMKLSDEDLCNAAKHGFFWEVDRYLIEARCFTLCETGQGNVNILMATPLFPPHFGYAGFHRPIAYRGMLVLHCEEQAFLIKLICPEQVGETTAVVEETPAAQAPEQDATPTAPQAPEPTVPVTPSDMTTEQAFGKVFDDLS